VDEEIGNDEDMGEEMLDDEESAGGDPMTCLIAFKKKVTDVLDDNDLAQKRASKMEIMDFLNLLSLFNAAGIHFK
jgi:18S rRNA (adenine1779-N6/adenine1780-N6)-dimethyltransferase